MKHSTGCFQAYTSVPQILALSIFILDFTSQDSYERLWELRDPRVDHLPLMGSYLPVIAISLIYVYIVKFWGPRHMEGKDPYEMR